MVISIIIYEIIFVVIITPKE